MQLILVRHGQPHQVSNVAGGADPELTAEGVEQAAALAREIAGGRWGPVAAVVSSTMLRARQTAQPIADALDLPLTTDGRLVELDRGWTSYGSVSTTSLSRAESLVALNSGRWGDDEFDPYEFQERVVAGVEDQVAADPEGAAVIVCHGGVINAYVTHAIGLPRLMFCFPRYTSVTRLRATPDGHRELQSLNETPHLPYSRRDTPGAAS